MNHLKRAVLGALSGTLITLLAYVGLLWGMPFEAGRIHHAIAFVSMVVLFPGVVFGAGDAFLVGNGFVWGTAIFLMLWYKSRQTGVGQRS